MSRFDDDFDDFDEREEIDETPDDDDDPSGFASAGPFGRPASSLPGASRVSGAGLPSRPAAPPGGGVPSPIRGTPTSAPGGGLQGGNSGAGLRSPVPSGGSTNPPFSKPGTGPLSRPATMSPADSRRDDERPKPPSSSFGSHSAPPEKRDVPRRDEGGKSPSGGLGGVASRFGGGDKRDEPRRDDGSKGPLGGLGKGLGGVTSRFGGGDDKDRKPDAKSGQSKSAGGGALGGFMSKLGGGGGEKKPQSKAPDKGGGKGPLSGLFGRGGDKKPDSSAPARPGSSSIPAASGSSTFGSRPPATGSSRPGNLPPTSAPPSKGGAAKGAKQSGPGLMSRIRNFQLFPPKQESKAAKAAAAARGSGKPVEVRTLSISLDKKLELLGIALVLSSIALLLTSLSPTPGAVTEQVNAILSKFFGWGAVAVPIAMFPVGIWLIMLRAGQETPVVDLTRVFGAVLLFLATLTTFQFIDSFNYPANEYATYTDYLAALRNVLLPLSAEFGRGGGRLGSELYYLLVSNFGELAGFVVLVGALIVSAMFALSLSAQEIIAIFISNYRNLRDAQRQRTMRQTAQRAERQAALAAQISVAKPGVEQLPGGKSPALPATASAAPAALAAATDVSRPEERSIPITMGGRTVTASFRPGEPLPDDEDEAVEAPIPMRFPAQAEPARPAAVEAKPQERRNLLGGIGSKLRGAAPVIGAAAVGAKLAADAISKETASQQAKPSDGGKDANKDKDKGRLGGGLFRRTVSKPADDSPLQPAASLVSPSAPTAPNTAEKSAEAAPEKGRFGGLSGVTGRFSAGRGAKPSEETGKSGSSQSSPAAVPTRPAVLSPVPDETAAEETVLPAAEKPTEGSGIRPSPRAPVTPSTPGQRMSPVPSSPAAQSPNRPGSPLPSRPTAAQPSVPAGAPNAAAPSTTDDDEEDAPPARLGDLLRNPVTPLSATPPGQSTASGTPSRPNPFQRPTLSPTPSSSILDDDEEDEDEILDKPVRTNTFRPASASSPRPPTAAPLKSPRPLDDDEDEDTILDVDDEESEDWSKLPPARPKGVLPTTPAAAPQRPTTPASPLRSPSAPIPDLQTRLNALRSGQPLGAANASATEEQAAGKPDSDDAEKPAAVRPAASLTPSGINAPKVDADRPQRATPPVPGSHADEKQSESQTKPADATPTTDRSVPRVSAPTPASNVVQPPPRPPSTSFGKPESPAIGPTRLSPVPERAPNAPQTNTPAESAPQRPAASINPPPSSTTIQRPLSPTPTPVGHGSAPPPPPPPARNAAPLGSPTAAQRNEEPATRTPAPPPTQRKTRVDWRQPDMNSLLTAGMDNELNHDQLIERARTIEETLSSFGAPGRVVEVRTGPVITQFGVEPDYVAVRGKKNRVKVSSIAGLDKDLQLALGAKSIRIEAPVPGKGYVGIEVPNEQAAVVRLRDVLESNEFKRIRSPLAIALGQGVDGTPVAADLTSMPHLLIAGTTGSGKSVCVNTIIASLLLLNGPDRVKFIMVDPKRVELTGYNGIPHLVAPVVVELERIVSVLKWVTREMDERYRKFSNAAARNIEDYNKHLPAGEPLLPYIIVIIDELADLMMLAPDETERVITRIAALARATGIHLVIATQRPSVDVVTGLIKANFPARIAFAVAGSVDSRVILDQPGAERLLGRGDMLYMSGDSPAPVRLQGVFVSDEEINNIVRFWRTQMDDPDLANAGKPIISQFMLDEASKEAQAPSGAKNGSFGQANRGSTGGQAFWDREVTGQSAPFGGSHNDDDDDEVGDGEDAMYAEAVEMVRRLNKASVSLLQRRLRIGYTRAARLIDVMEERGIVGPPTEGSKPREVLPAKD